MKSTRLFHLWRTYSIAIACATLFSISSGVIPAKAEATTDDVLFIDNNDLRRLLDSNDTHRYTFILHRSRNPKLETQVFIELTSNVPNAFHFEVKRADTMKTIGRSVQLNKLTNQDRDELAHIWVGGASRETLKLFVDVTNSSPFPSEYSLQIAGTDISFSTPDKEAALPVLLSTEGQDVTSTKPANKPKGLSHQLVRTGLRKVQQPESDTPGSSPKRALEIDNEQWFMLEPKQSRWYAFEYDFDQHAESKTKTTVQIETEVIDSLHLSIMTSRMKILGYGISQDEVTGYSGDDSRIIWASETLISGRYFIEVINEGRDPVKLNLSVQHQQ